MIIYASNDCLSLAQLIVFIYEPNLSSARHYFQYSPGSGEYLFYKEQNISEFSFTNSSREILAFTDEQTNHSMTVHEKNERHSMEISNAVPHPQQTQDDQIQSINHYSKLLHDTSVTKSKISHCRSLKARKRRNQKTSIRHRKNRYNYGISRPVNTNIKIVKQILKSYIIKYTNINIVRSTLYIGLKSLQHQDEYKQ
ncbi:unnamed protein product, partial [Rotaria sp. Silwood2]